jgi:hypothetical protein
MTVRGTIQALPTSILEYHAFYSIGHFTSTRMPPPEHRLLVEWRRSIDVVAYREFEHIAPLAMCLWTRGRSMPKSGRLSRANSNDPRRSCRLWRVLGDNLR